MHKSRLGALIIDCQTDDLTEATAFWSRALGYAVAPTQTSDRYVSLEGPAGELAISLQKVEHASRVHLDIEADDIEAEVKRLEGLGAKVAERIKSWVVMEAPSGQRFCVVRPQRPDFPANATSYP